MKKSISFLLILTMILSMLCIVPAVADGDEKQSGDFSYRIKRNGTAVITGYNFPASAKNLSIAVPITIDGYPVTEIGEEAFSVSYDNREQYQNVSIYLPDGITSIGNFAFRYLCVTALNIPDSVEEIGYGIFSRGNRYYYSDTTLNISINHPYFALINGLLYNKQQKKLIASTTSELDSITIPEGIISIGDYALAGIRLSQVTFPSTLKTIGSHAFEDCYLKHGDITFANVRTIGAFAFFNCLIDSIKKTKIIFQSLEEIGECAFATNRNTSIAGCSALYVDFDDSPITIIQDYAFVSFGYYYSEIHINKINLKSIVSVGKFNFLLGYRIESASDFPPHLTSIPEGLNPSVNFLPNTVKRIESNAYVTSSSDYDKRTDFYLPTSLEYIAEDAFAIGSTFIVEPDSYALRWCKENGFGYKINGEKQDLDWLNN